MCSTCGKGEVAALLADDTRDQDCPVPDLLHLLLVGAAVNGPWRPALVVYPVGDLVKALLQAVPVSAQAAQQAVKVLTCRFNIHPPVVQVT